MCNGFIKLKVEEIELLRKESGKEIFLIIVKALPPFLTISTLLIIVWLYSKGTNASLPSWIVTL